VRRIALVVNPRAGRGRVGRELAALVKTLATAGLSAEVYETSHRGHAIELARTAALKGFDTVVAVGGDGTVNEVVNGLIDGDLPVSAASLGVVAAGSGADFARSFGLPKHVDHELAGIEGRTRRLDVGKIQCSPTIGSEPVTRYFVNAAEAGMAAATVERAERLPRWFGKARYLIAFWPSLVRFDPVEMTVSVGTASHTGLAHNALVANGRYIGGGMQISPHSDPGDGRFDIQVNIGPKRQALTLVPKIYRGSHLPDQRIIQMSGPDVVVDTARPVPIEADGEMVGVTPARFSILPGVLELMA
jgi:YegS/Rv2252/BmrU family lipid kinase